MSRPASSRRSFLAAGAATAWAAGSVGVIHAAAGPRPALSRRFDAFAQTRATLYALPDADYRTPEFCASRDAFLGAARLLAFSPARTLDDLQVKARAIAIMHPDLDDFVRWEMSEESGVDELLKGGIARDLMLMVRT